MAKQLHAQQALTDHGSRTQMDRQPATSERHPASDSGVGNAATARALEAAASVRVLEAADSFDRQAQAAGSSLQGLNTALLTYGRLPDEVRTPDRKDIAVALALILLDVAYEAFLQQYNQAQERADATADGNSTATVPGIDEGYSPHIGGRCPGADAYRTAFWTLPEALRTQDRKDTYRLISWVTRDLTDEWVEPFRRRALDD